MNYYFNQKLKVNNKCPICNKLIQLKSKTCNKHKIRSKQHKLNLKKALSSKKIKKKCFVCKKIFWIKKSRKEKTKFCSKKCYGEFREGLKLSKKHCKKNN